MSFDTDLRDALANVNRRVGQARFHGNERTRIEAEMSESRLIRLFRTFGNPHGVGGQVRELVAILAQGQWHITASVHRGGLGGAAGGADPRNHITLSTGHHIRFGTGGIVEITGPGIEPIAGRAQREQDEAAAAAAAANAAGGDSPPPGSSPVEWVKATFGLNDRQAVWVVLHKRTVGGSYPTLAEEARRNRA